MFIFQFPKHRHAHTGCGMHYIGCGIAVTGNGKCNHAIVTIQIFLFFDLDRKLLM